MPVSGGASSSHSQAPTHHQLDELDALMQRMLALPVDPLDSASDPLAELLPPEQQKVRSSPVSKETLRDWDMADTFAFGGVSNPHAEDALPILPRSETLGSPASREDPADPPAVGPLSGCSDIQCENGEAHSVAADDHKVSAISSPLDQAKKPQIEHTVECREAEGRGGFPGMNPILIMNWVYDQVLGRFGSRGLWLRSLAGRDFIGLVAIIIALGSVAWLLWGMMAWIW